MEKITRRLFLRAAPSAAVVAGAVAVPPAIEAGQALTAQLTAIPTDVWEAIHKWQTEHRRMVRAANAYSDSLRAKNVDHAQFMEMVHAEREVGPAREAMIAALLSI